MRTKKRQLGGGRELYIELTEKVDNVYDALNSGRDPRNDIYLDENGDRI